MRLALAFAGAFGFALASAASGGTPVGHLLPAPLPAGPDTVLPAPPPWIASAASVATIDAIAAGLKEATSKPPPINYVRQSFLLPDIRWLRAYARWFVRLGKPLHLHFEDELFDCDKYSRCFDAFADLVAAAAGERRASLAIGWAVVFNDRAFAGVESGGRHAIVIVATTAGLYVVEPQNGTIVPLRDYPNRERLSAVYL